MPQAPITDWPREPLQRERERTAGESTGWIQWKGTDVCIDIRCVCGYRGHLDCSFLYFYRCHGCGQLYSVGQTVVLFPVADGCKGAPGPDDGRVHAAPPDDVNG